MRTFQFIPPPLVIWFDPVWPSLLGRLVPVLSLTCTRLRAWCHTGSHSARESSQSNHAHCTVSRYIAYQWDRRTSYDVLHKDKIGKLLP